MLFTNITDCELLVFRCIQEATPDISLVQIMDVLEKKYNKIWKRSTVCTFISHLIDKGYVASRRSGRTFYYSCIVDDRAFKEEQTRQFMNFWFNGSVSDLFTAACVSKKIPKKNIEKVSGIIQEIDE